KLCERQIEALRELPCPLRAEVRGRHDKNPIAGPPKDQLLHVEASHDRLASPWVVCQEEARSWFPEKAVVYRLELMRKRLDVRHRQRRHVVLKGHLDSVCFDPEPKPMRVSIEA